MENCIVFEDCKIIKSYNGFLWDGLFSQAESNGKIIEYIQSILPNNTLLIIPKSDGNITMSNSVKEWHDINWDKQIQPYIDYAKEKNKIFMIGTLCQITEENYNYVYLPLDDKFFCYGVNTFFKKDSLTKWEERSSELCWRGGCSGVGDLESIRVRFVKKIYDYNPDTNVRLSTWWSENKNIPNEYFADRINYSEFTKYKIFFIVDGNCIASNHMYGFATGCVPFMISNGICWFSHLIKPYEHYIPINYDLSNLIEQIEWVKNNDEQAKIIAENAYKFSEKHFSSEYQKKYLKETIEKYCISLKHDRKIIDCFTFYNELELLYYRLTILNDYVDYFILVEANHTHAGNKKILYYEKNKFLFKRFENKIIHIIVDLPHIYPDINYSKNEQWVNENFQRNSINQGIKELELNKQDLIIISDLDEIINPEILLKLKNDVIEIKEGGFSLLQDMYYYNLNTKHTDIWRLDKIVTYDKYLTTTPQEIRTSADLPSLENGGWHLSYFGNTDFIKNKLKEFAHQEYNNSYYTDEKNIEEKINNKKDLFNRHYVPVKYISVNENNNLPPLYNKYLLNYIENNNLSNVPVYIYFHICCINNWKQIFSKLMFKIKNSGLYNIIKEIRCVILGEYDNSINDPKINIILQSTDINLAVKITINNLFNDSVNNDEEFYVLYIHTKGIKHFNGKFEKNVDDWVEYMSYFNIYNFNLCLNELKNYSAVGVNLQISNDYPLHYSGNFWWSKSSHIRKLKLIEDNFYNSPEFWVTSINENYKTLWNSNTHHYNDPYPYYLYENKNI